MSRRLTLDISLNNLAHTKKGQRRQRSYGRPEHHSLTGIEELEFRRLLAFDFELPRSPTDLPADAEFGKSVAISDGLAIVGAPQDDDHGSNSGSVYIYEGDKWVETPPKLTAAADASEGDRFGWSVAMDGNTIVVGAPFDDDNGMSSGSVYVFTRSPSGEFSEPAKLRASDGAVGDVFGRSVAIDGDRIVVGAPFAKIGQTPTGAAYVYERDLSGTWGEEEVDKLIATDGAFLDEFGTSVAIHGDTIAVGANRDDDMGEDSGSVYIFEPGSDFAQTQKLTAFDGRVGDCFGFSLATDGNMLVVGAFLQDGGGADSGKVYVYDQSSPFELVTSLTPSVREADAHFGYSVSIDAGNPLSVEDDLIIVGAPGETVRKDTQEFANAGAAYVFDRTGTLIEQIKPPLIANEPGSGDRLGESVAILAGTGSGSPVAVVGAPLDGNSSVGTGTVGSVRFFLDAEAADLVISKSDSPDPVLAGDQLTYTITVENLGPSDAENVVVTDTLPAGVSNAVTDGCVEDADGVPICTLGTIAAGDFAQYTITVDVDASTLGVITNNASVDSSTPRINTGDDSVSGDTTVVAEAANLVIGKSDSSDPVLAGDQLTYTITVENSGPNDAENVVVTDTLPAGVSNAVTDGCVEDADGVPICTLGTIAAGDFAQYTITVDVDASTLGVITNNASVDSSTPRINTGDDSVSEDTTVTPPIKLPPMLDLDADAPGVDFSTTFTEGGGLVAIASSNATLQDVDSGNLSSLTVTITNPLDGADEVLDANTDDTVITKDYVGNVLTLSGTDIVANYQQVLRTATYDNQSTVPTTTNRSIIFVANDGATNSNIATTTVTIKSCDFNGDGLCNADDINLLMNEAETGGTSTDLNKDGVVNDDRDEWLAIAGPVNGFAGPLLVGDADLNGKVDAHDLNALGLSWEKLDEFDWTAGNFTVDGGPGVRNNDLNALGVNWQSDVAAAVFADDTMGAVTDTSNVSAFRSARRQAFEVADVAALVVNEKLTNSIFVAAVGSNDGSPNNRSLDVNQDGFVSPLDALLVISSLDSSTQRDDGPNILDVTGDGIVSPLDALWIIAHLGALDSASAIQESNPTEVLVAPKPALAAAAGGRAYDGDDDQPNDSHRDLPDTAQAIAEIYDGVETIRFEDLPRLPISFPSRLATTHTKATDAVFAKRVFDGVGNADLADFRMLAAAVGYLSEKQQL